MGKAVYNLKTESWKNRNRIYVRRSKDCLRRDRTVMTSRRLKNRNMWDGLYVPCLWCINVAGRCKMSFGELQNWERATLSLLSDPVEVESQWYEQWVEINTNVNNWLATGLPKTYQYYVFTVHVSFGSVRLALFYSCCPVFWMSWDKTRRFATIYW